MKVFVLNRKKLVLLGAMIISTVIFAGVNTIISVSKNSPSEVPVYSVKRDDNKISLTFNCAWGNEDIPEILETLKRYNTKATFFIVGEWAEKYPEDVKKIYDSGHEIGSHSYNHSHYKEMSYDEILKDMERCDNAIESIIGKDIYLVRGGYGEYSDDVLKVCKNSNRTYIQWSVDSIDYKAGSPDEITKKVIEKTKPGDIILMHTGTEYTHQALDSLLANLCQNHTPVPVSELIYKDNFTIDHSGCQIPNKK